MFSNSASLGLISSVFLSVNHRDKSLFPSASDFTVDLPNVINKVNGVAIRHFRYTPETLINNNNKDLVFFIDNGAENKISITKGDYNQDIDELLNEINAKITGFSFAVNSDNLIVVSTNSTLTIQSSNLVTLLGFSGDITISGTADAAATATATSAFRLINNTDLILRITDIEAILSVNSAYNRATAILLSSRSPKSVVEQVQYTYTPLLQIQHRVQRLRVKILNSDGDPYDLADEDASFSIDFYCKGNDEM